ncbi:MAG: glycosyltransferase [Synechococcus sp.]|nr:glycosyltransferase [Synechococcus sp.]
MLDVIIPLKNRPFWDCVQSLLKIPAVTQVLLCDGGSTEAAVFDLLNKVANQPQIKVFRYSQASFNKAQLLNQGILQATAPFLLMSDGDILWSQETVQSLLAQVNAYPQTLAVVAQVEESEPKAIAPQRPRYNYRLHRNQREIRLELYPEQSLGQERPGCGLVCGDRQSFLQLGGYHECFQGWGWEDQDLLLRAEIFGYQITKVGQVIHQSHPDPGRNQCHRYLSPLVTRDRNIRRCLAALRAKQFYGDLPCIKPQPLPTLPLRIQAPPELWPDHSFAIDQK